MSNPPIWYATPHHTLNRKPLPPNSNIATILAFVRCAMDMPAGPPLTKNRFRLSSKRYPRNEAGIRSSRSSFILVCLHQAQVALYLGCQSLTSDTTAGKILKDEDTVESYKIEEKGFVVCVVNKVSCAPESGKDYSTI
jgi:hypothetical protein